MLSLQQLGVTALNLCMLAAPHGLAALTQTQQHAMQAIYGTAEWHVLDNNQASAMRRFRSYIKATREASKKAGSLGT